MVDNFSPPVVYIEAYDDTGNHRSGSGTLIRFLDKNGPCYLIVTCLHVVNLSENSLQLSKNIKVWCHNDAFFPEKKTYAAEIISHGPLPTVNGDGDDLALLRIKGDLELSGISDFLLSTDIKEKMPLSFYGYPLARERFREHPYKVVYKPEYTYISTKPGNSIYKVNDPLTAKGVSGGGVFCQKSHKLVGVWRGIWTGKLNYDLEENLYAEGVVIGLHWIKELCRETEYHLEWSSPEIEQPEKVSISEEFTTLIKKKISEIIESEESANLRASLIHQVKEQDIRDWLARISPGDLCEDIFCLTSAVEESFEKVKKEEGAGAKIRNIWKDACQILGWLVLLSVDYDWIKSEGLMQKSLQELELEIPVATDAGVEIFFSALGKSQAKFEVTNPGGFPFGKDGVRYTIPEAGWENSNTVLTIKQLIWKKVFPHEKLPTEFKDFENKKLNQTLSIRRRRGEHRYLAANSPKISSPFKAQVYHQLKKELSHLNFIIIATDDKNTIFAVHEADVESYLIDFFSKKPE